MRSNKIKKIIAIGIITSELILPLLVLAQAVPNCSSNDGDTCAGGYLVGIPANVAAEGELKSEYGLYKTSCVVPLETFEQANKAAQLGFSGLSMIGGSGALLAQFQLEIEAYDLFLKCALAHQVTLTGLPAGNVFLSNIKQSLLHDINSAIQTYTDKKAQSQAKSNNAKQGFWKTLVFNILIKTSKAVADALVTKLVNNYKIRDYKQYADSLATLAYDNQFIRDNFPSAQGQLMARAILENPLVRNQVQPGIFVAADAALGFDPKGLNPNDPFFYSKMASVGSSQANPYYQHSIYVGGVDQARANSLAYAQGNISQSQGLKAPVNCAGTLAQQKAIDGQTKAASDELANRKALLTSLQQAQSLNQNLSVADKTKLESDLALAQRDYQAALTSWNNLPYAVTGKGSVSQSAVGGGNNIEGTAAITICEAIVSPAVLVNKGIDKAFDAIGLHMAQYNDNNLPGFMTLIGDVASQIGSSLIFGGSGGAKGALLVNEGRLVSGAVQVANEAVYAKTSENLAKGIVFGPPTPSSSGSADSYTLTWEVIPDQIKTANFVTISGDGVSSTKVDPVTKVTTPNRLPLSSSYAITTKIGGTYVITVFDINGKALTSGTTTLTPTFNPGSSNPNLVCGGSYSSVAACVAENGTDYCNTICSSVQGAFTNTPSLQIRGSSVIVEPRGH